MQINTNWYWNLQPNHHVITVPTRKKLHTQLEINVITDFRTIPTSLCPRIQGKKCLLRQPIRLNGYDYDYILEEIGRREKIDFEIYVDVYSDDMED